MSSNEIGHQYLDQLSNSFLSEAGASRIERPINLPGPLALVFGETNRMPLKGLPLLMIIMKYQNKFISFIQYANLLKMYMMTPLTARFIVKWKSFVKRLLQPSVSKIHENNC